jgi:hypothetical protein
LTLTSFAPPADLVLEEVCQNLAINARDGLALFCDGATVTTEMT